MTVHMEHDGGIAVITLDNPAKLNALSRSMYRELSEIWREVRDDREIRCAIVTGAGDRAFSTGADLNDILDGGELADFMLTQQDQLLNKGLEVWKPVIAAVNGYCLGGGLTMLLATDIRLAVPDATFGLSEVQRGVIPANGGTQRAVAQLPYAIAMELLLTGERIDAETALRWGLINRIVERDSLLDTAREIAERIAANAPLAVQATKELAVRSRDLDLAAGLRLEESLARLLKSSADAAEGTQAFLERRRPRYGGR